MTAPFLLGMVIVVGGSSCNPDRGQVNSAEQSVLGVRLEREGAPPIEAAIMAHPPLNGEEAVPPLAEALARSLKVCGDTLKLDSRGSPLALKFNLENGQLAPPAKGEIGGPGCLNDALLGVRIAGADAIERQVLLNLRQKPQG